MFLLQVFIFSFFLKFLEVTCPFCGATDTPVLDFWWCLPWVSKPGWNRLHAFLPVHYSSDSPLVRHLLTSWWPAWQPSQFDPHTCSRQTYPQALVVLRSEPWLEPMALAGARTHDLPCHSTAHLTTRPLQLSCKSLSLTVHQWQYFVISGNGCHAKWWPKIPSPEVEFLPFPNSSRGANIEALPFCSLKRY